MDMGWVTNSPSWFIENVVVAMLKKLPRWLAVTTFASMGIDIKDETIANATGIVMIAVAAKPELAIQILSQAIGLMADGAIGIAEAVSFMFMVPVNAVGGGISRYRRYRNDLRLQGEEDATTTSPVTAVAEEVKIKKQRKPRVVKKNDNTRTGRNVARNKRMENADAAQKLPQKLPPQKRRKKPSTMKHE